MNEETFELDSAGAWRLIQILNTGGWCGGGGQYSGYHGRVTAEMVSDL